MRLSNTLLKIIFIYILFSPLFTFALSTFDKTSLQCVNFANEFCKEKSNTLWQLTFCDNKGKEICKVSNLDADKLSYKKENSKQFLIFDKIPIKGKKDQLTVKVTITSANNNKEFWHISWNNKTNLEIKKVKFPILTQVIKPGFGDVMFPIGCYGGRLFVNNRAAKSNIYPSFTGFTQLASFTIKNKTLAIFPRDKAGLVKTFSLLPNQSYSIETEVPLNSKSLPFDIEFALFNGNYLAAAKEYRAWAIECAPWLKKGHLAKRKDLPQSFFQNGPWFCMGWMPPESMNEMVKRAQDACGMPISLHWYVWHKEQFDSKYPELNPKKGFNEAVNKMQKRGNFIIPYINGHLWDQSLPSYQNAKKHVVIKKDGSIATESWGTPKRKFSVMCPGTTFYQDFLAKYASNLITNAQLKGLYLDQISAVIPSWCYDKNHQHTPGPNAYWLNGYNKLLEKIKYTTKNQTALFSECAQEIHYNNITGNLCWIPMETEDIPLLSAIYSGYTTFFGSPASQEDTFRAFAVVQQRALLWGVQPGWSQSWLINKKEHAQYLGKLGKLRLKLLPYLTFGEYWGEIPLKNLHYQDDTLHYKGPSGTIRNIKTLSIQTALWKNSKGHLLYLFANSTGLTQSIKDKIICPKGKYTAKVDGKADFVVCNNTLPISLSLSPYEVRYIELVPYTKEKTNNKYSAFSTLADYGLLVEEEIDSQQKTKSSDLQIHWKIKNISNKTRKIFINQIPYTISAQKEIPIKQIINNPIIVQIEGKKVFFTHKPKTIEELEFFIENQDVVESNTSVPVIVNIQNNTQKNISLLSKLTINSSWILPKSNTINIVAKPGFSSIKIPLVSPNITARKKYRGRINILRNKENIFSQRLAYQVVISPPKCKALFLSKKPIIDCNLEEYAKCDEIKLTPQTNGKKSPTVFANNNDCSAVVKLGYDKDNLYFACVVNDNVHNQVNSETSLWKGDCIQIALLGKRNRKGGLTGEEKDFVMALTSYGSELYDFQNKSCFGNLLVIRKNGQTIYEAAIPWKHLLLTPNKEEEMAISFVISDNDGTSSMKGYLELTPGIFGTKDSSLYRPLQFR